MACTSPSTSPAAAPRSSTSLSPISPSPPGPSRGHRNSCSASPSRPDLLRLFSVGGDLVEFRRPPRRSAVVDDFASAGSPRRVQARLLALRYHAFDWICGPVRSHLRPGVSPLIRVPEVEVPPVTVAPSAPTRCRRSRSQLSPASRSIADRSSPTWPYRAAPGDPSGRLRRAFGVRPLTRNVSNQLDSGVVPDARSRLLHFVQERVPPAPISSRLSVRAPARNAGCASWASIRHRFMVPTARRWR